VARYMLESIAMVRWTSRTSLKSLWPPSLGTLLQDQLTRRENVQSGPKLQRLDKVLDMNKASAMSNTIAFSKGADLESINKGKCVNDGCLLRAICLMYYFLESEEGPV
jgi:ATP-binding cassette subfamily F protein 3